MNLPQRKQLRLQHYDYKINGYYFITICTHNRKLLFGDNGVQKIARDLTEEVFTSTVAWHRNVQCPKYVLMPNHLHAILAFEAAAVSVPQFVKSFKTRSTAEYAKYVREGILPAYDGTLWQRSFYDEIIRNEDHFQKVWTYIENNPLQWELDDYYKG